MTIKMNDKRHPLFGIEIEPVTITIHTTGQEVDLDEAREQMEANGYDMYEDYNDEDGNPLTYEDVTFDIDEDENIIWIS